MEVIFLLDALKLGISNMATQAVKDAYDKLKMLLQDRLNHNPTAKNILAKYEHEPKNKTLEDLLKAALENANVDQDYEIQRAAEELKKRVVSSQAVLASPGATSTQVHGSTLQSGNGNTQTVIGEDQISINGNRNQVLNAKQKGKRNTIVGRDFINHKIPLPMWALLLILTISGGLGFGSGALLENQRLSPALEEAQKKVGQTTLENSILQETVNNQKNRDLQALEDLKKTLKATEKDLSENRTRLKNAEAELQRIKDEAARAAKSLNGTWELQKADYVCITQRTQGFSGIDGINCFTISDKLGSTNLVINQTGNNFTIESASSSSVKSGSIGQDGTFIAKGTDQDGVETVLNGKLINNNEITGTLSVYARGNRAYSTEFSMKRKAS